MSSVHDVKPSDDDRNDELHSLYNNLLLNINPTSLAKNNVKQLLATDVAFCNAGYNFGQRDI